MEYEGYLNFQCRRAIRARFPECNVFKAVNASIMMNLHVLVLVIYTALCGMYKTAYAVLLTKQHNDFIRIFCLCFMLHYEVFIEQRLRYLNQNS